MTDAEAIIQSLLEANPIREPALRSIIKNLNLPAGSRGLDAGCGIGLQAVMLAEAIGPDGHVTGLDILPELLGFATEKVARAGLANRISFQVGDVNCLPFEDHRFHWAWSTDCIGYPVGDLKPLLEELLRVVKPGGSIILLGWSSQQLLPGYPLLEARLNATCSAYNPFLKGQSPQSHFMRAAGCFQSLGLEDIRAHTFAGDVRAPFSESIRTALTSLFAMLWGTPQPGVSAEDWADYQRLCTQRSPDFILDIPRYYAFFTYTMFRGTVPES